MRFSRHLSFFLLTTFLALSTVSPSLAWSPEAAEDARGEIATYTGNHAKNMMTIVENLPWLPDGKDTGKYLYVFFSPGCQFSKELFKETRALTDSMQIRWIPVDADGDLNSMYEERNSDTIKKAFTTMRVPSDRDKKKTAAINSYAVAGITWLTAGQMASPDGNVYFPTLIYGTAEKATVGIGPLEDMKKFIADIPVVEVKKDFSPESIELATKKIEIIPVPEFAEYENKGKDVAEIKLLPLKEAARTGGISAGDKFPIPVAGVTRSGFVAFVITEKKDCIFVEDPAFVENALKGK